MKVKVNAEQYDNLMVESHFSMDNINAVFYLGSRFWMDGIGPAKSTVAHEHAWYEFHCVKKGCLKVKTDEKTYLIKANEALFIPPRTYHISETADSDTVYTSFGFEISNNGKQTAENLYISMSDIFSSSPFVRLTKCRQIADLTQQLMHYTKSGGRPSDFRFHNMLSSFLFLLSDRLRDDWALLPPSQEVTEETLSDLRNNLLDYITNNQINEMTLEELSQKIYLNKKQINRIIKKRYNMTYKQKQIRFRIENAKKQLLESSLPVDRIAHQVGYANLTRFYKMFRKIVGVTPAQYRKQARENKTS